MAVRANDVALCDLVKDGTPVVPPDAVSDAELLLTTVIELEDDRIALTAVGARMLAEEVTEKCRSFRYEGVPAARRRGNVALSICEVMLSFIGGSARAAVGIEVSYVPAAPSKL
jgi:predicted short-subunit dehydrogenase-like oxidoreductase (DUF2520 family)